MCGWIASLTCDVEPGLKLLAHRGIRTTKTETRCGASLGHVRLPIVGLGREYDQPAQFGQNTMVFVGELLNFREIDPTLECDLPLAVKTWDLRGPEGFREFDGFWSIAVVNDRHRTMHLLCDYLAQKPTYYRKDIAAAASELDALVALAPVTPNETYFAAVIKWGYCPEAWRTPYQEVSRVLPGEHVVMTETGCRQRSVDPLASQKTDLKREIDLAVRRRVLSSDVPVACLVSGGLDSSIVYILARKHGTVQPYFADDPIGDLDEQVRVSAVTSPQPVIRIAWNLVSTERALFYMQEPIDLGSLVPQTALSDQVRERVCLTGDGADEAFGGYGRSMRYDSQASDLFHELVCWHLPRLDRIMMRNRIEVRSPFLARSVVQGAMALPWSARQNKVYLREMFRDDLPKGIADAPKKPLRTAEVEASRESRSIDFVRSFRRQRWPMRVTQRMAELRELMR